MCMYVYTHVCMYVYPCVWVSLGGCGYVTYISFIFYIMFRLSRIVGSCTICKRKLRSINCNDSMTLYVVTDQR